MPVHLQQRRRFLTSLLAAGLPCALTGCGTVLHPERRGQKGGKLDMRIVGLNAAGLLLFFVPGVIAFAIDFHQGTIFLPEGSTGTDDEHASLIAVSVPRTDLSRSRIEATVSAHAARQIRLTPGDFRSTPLDDIDSFWTSRDRLMQSMDT